jgi:hypothetical protein
MTVQAGAAILKWGTEDENWGYCEDIAIREESDKEQIKNGDGDTVGLYFSDVRQKVTANYTPLAGADSPPFTKTDIVGAELTVKTEEGSTIKIRVDDAEKKYVKGGGAAWAVTGYKYPNLADASS